jgi:hypothetical protein
VEAVAVAVLLVEEEGKTNAKATSTMDVPMKKDLVEMLRACWTPAGLPGASRSAGAEAWAKPGCVASVNHKASPTNTVNPRHIVTR